MDERVPAGREPERSRPVPNVVVTGSAEGGRAGVGERRITFLPSAPRHDGLLTGLPEVTGVVRGGDVVVVTGNAGALAAVASVPTRNQIVAHHLRVDQARGPATRPAPTDVDERSAMSTLSPAEQHLNHPRARAAFRGAKLLVGGYLAISALTLVAIVLLRDDAAVVNSAVWTRGTIVVASAMLMFSFVVRAAKGSRGAYRRLRVVSAAMVVAIAVIISIPGTFPLWMKIKQGVCGLVLIGVVVVVNGRHVRSSFATA